MSCLDEGTLSLYASGALEGDEARAIADHVASCERCAAQVADASSVLADLAAGTPADPGPAFWAAFPEEVAAAAGGSGRGPSASVAAFPVRSREAGGSRGEPRSRGRGWGARVSAAFGGAAAAGLALWLALTPGGRLPEGDPPTPAAALSVSSDALDQLAELAAADDPIGTEAEVTVDDLGAEELDRLVAALDKAIKG